MPSARCGGHKEFGKFLVVRRDGTIPAWTWFVLGSRDPHAPTALHAYAASVRAEAASLIRENDGATTPRATALVEYARDLERTANQFADERETTGSGDPEAGPHRKDNPAVLALMKPGAKEDLSGLTTEMTARRCYCTKCEERRFAALGQGARNLERVAREQAKRSATPKTAARRFHAFESEVEKLADALRDEIAPRTSLGIAGDLGHALGALGTIDADGCAEAAEILERLAQDERDSQELNEPEPCTAGERDADPA